MNFDCIHLIFSKKIILICFSTVFNLFYSPHCATSQNGLMSYLPDTVNTRLEVLESAIEQTDYLLETIEHTPTEQNRLIVTLAQICLKIAKENDLQIAEAKATFWEIANIHEDQYYSSNNLLNLGRLNKIFYIFEQTNIHLWETRTKMISANIYYHLQNDSMGLVINNQVLDSLKKFDSSKYPLLFGDTYKNRGNLLWSEGNMDSVIWNYETNNLIVIYQ